MTDLSSLSVEQFLSDQAILTQLRRLYDAASPAQRKAMKSVFSSTVRRTTNPALERAKEFLEQQEEPSVLELVQRAHDESMRVSRPSWSGMIPAFEQSLDAPIVRLTSGLLRIETQTLQLECARRFALLYFRLELHARAYATGLPWKKAARVALAGLSAEVPDIDMAQLQSWKKAAYAYHIIWAHCPGLLLILGANTSSRFERNITQHAIDAYIQCIQTRVPELWAAGLKLRQTAVQVFFHGLAAYGGSQKITVQSMAITRERLDRPLVGSNAVPDDAECVRLAIAGDIDRLRALFIQGKASPNVYSVTRHFSLLRWTLYAGMHNHPTVNFLLESGAEVDQEVYDHVWDFYFRGLCSEEQYHQLQGIFYPATGYLRGYDWYDEQEFPLPHRIVLRRDSSNLEEMLHVRPGLVDQRDKLGRTALDWAAACAKIDIMQLLIAWGAHLESVDHTGRSTLLHAVDSHNLEAVQLLLIAGAEAEPRVAGRSTPLNAASYGGLYDIMNVLIAYGADVLSANPEGRTPLQAASSVSNRQVSNACVQLLLIHGAQMVNAEEVAT